MGARARGFVDIRGRGRRGRRLRLRLPRRSDVLTKRTAFAVGPSVRYLFVDGALRPFVEAGAGVGFDSTSNDQPGRAIEGTTLYARGGPGVQVRLADAVSLDFALRVGFASTSGTLDEPAIVGRGYNATTGVYSPLYTTRPEHMLQQLSADLFARLSIWL